MMNFKKSFLGFVLLPIASIVAFSGVASAETIRTKHFQINITRNCSEGNISCDDVTYVGQDLRTGKSIRLTGKTVNRARSYTFLGYEFRNGPYTYSVTRNNVLLIYKDEQLILREQGVSIGD